MTSTWDKGRCLQNFLFQQPRIVLPAIRNPVHIHRVIAYLVQYKIPALYIQLVILVYRDIVLIEKRIALGAFPAGSAFPPETDASV